MSLDARTILERPFHVGDQPGHRELLPPAVLEHFLDQRQHRVLIEVPVAQVRLFPAAHFELTRLLARLRVDARRGSVSRWRSRFAGSTMWTARSPAENPSRMKGSMHLVELVLGMEERAGVAAAADLAAGKIHFSTGSMVQVPAAPAKSRSNGSGSWRLLLGERPVASPESLIANPRIVLVWIQRSSDSRLVIRTSDRPAGPRT